MTKNATLKRGTLPFLVILHVPRGERPVFAKHRHGAESVVINLQRAVVQKRNDIVKSAASNKPIDEVYKCRAGRYARLIGIAARQRLPLNRRNERFRSEDDDQPVVIDERLSK